MIAYLNDDPTVEDLLARKDLVKAAGDRVAQCDAPQVLGIHGDWGAGKTSFLYQLHLYLKGECPQAGVARAEGVKIAKKAFPGWAKAENVTVIWFEAWRYQNEARPVVALLHEIRSQLSWSIKSVGKAKQLGEVAVRGALLSIENITKMIGFQASKFDQAGKQWEEEHLASKLPSYVLREQLDSALKSLLPKVKNAPDPRLVVLIDDLDRCEPEVAFRLLEGLKIYLNLKNCVFVLGMDQLAIQRAIAKQLPENESADSMLHARDYLEKICQEIWHLPIYPDPATLLDGYLESMDNRALFVDVIREYRCLPANARKIKAFSNLLNRYKAYIDKRPLIDDPKSAAKLIVIMASLYQFHHPLYRQLEANPKFYGLILDWCRGSISEEDYPVFSHLRGTRKKDKQKEKETVSETTPGDPSLVDAYPDSALGNVLRIQTLITSTGDIPESRIEAYLLDQPIFESAGVNDET